MARAAIPMKKKTSNKQEFIDEIEKAIDKVLDKEDNENEDSFYVSLDKIANKYGFEYFSDLEDEGIIKALKKLYPDFKIKEGLSRRVIELAIVLIKK